MKRIRYLVLTLITSGALASAQGLTKDAKIERILDLTNANAIMDQMFNQIKSISASLAPKDATPEQAAKSQELQNKILDFVRARMSWEKMRPQFVKAYSETFSDEEISGILAFYESPVGRAMLTKLPTLLSKTMSVAQDQMRDIMPEIERMMKESLQK